MLRFALLFWRVLSSRAVRLLVYAWIALWGLDRAIFWVTEAAWFGSVGQGAWFGARFLAEFGLFWGSFFLALISAAAAMRVAAHPLGRRQNAAPAPAPARLVSASGASQSSDAPNIGAPGQDKSNDASGARLPRALVRLEPLRRGATRLAWLVLLVGAWWSARQMASGWPLVLAASAGTEGDFATVWKLPLWHLAGVSLWRWLVITLGATAFAGVLRALPFLARREPLAPLGLWRMLGVLGALALVARGALYLVENALAVASDGASAGELWIGWPLAVAGALACALAAVWCLKRPGFRRLSVAVAVALLGPRIGQVVLAPLGLVLPLPPGVAAREIRATRAGWGLDGVPTIDRAAPPLAAHWPIWNETALLGVARGEHERYKAQVTDWRAAFVEGTTGTVVGVAAALDNWGSRHEAEAETALSWLALDASQNVGGVAPEIVDAPLPLRSFYGVSGRPLAGSAPLEAGVPFGNWGWKLAWIWRLRDPLLLLDGARAGRLLAFRGARESAQKLAPFLVWDEARLRRAPDGARWEAVGYAATAHFRGARALGAGEFAGFNAAAPAALALIDPRNGRVEFEALPGPTWSAGWAKVLNADADQSTPQTPLDTPLLARAQAEMARQLGARDVLDEPVWTWAGGHGALVRRAANWPAGIEARLAALDDAAARDWAGVENVEGKTLQPGDALLWPDARAPGSFWVGRPYYSAVRIGGSVARAAHLWRVGLTGLSAASPLASGADARAALLNFDLISRPAPRKTPVKVEAEVAALALEALRAHDAAQKAAANSKWDEWAKESARERQLIEELAARQASK